MRIYETIYMDLPLLASPMKTDCLNESDLSTHLNILLIQLIMDGLLIGKMAKFCWRVQQDATKSLSQKPSLFHEGSVSVCRYQCCRLAQKELWMCLSPNITTKNVLRFLRELQMWITPIRNSITFSKNHGKTTFICQNIRKNAAINTSKPMYLVAIQ